MCVCVCVCVQEDYTEALRYAYFLADTMSRSLGLDVFPYSVFLAGFLVVGFRVSGFVAGGEGRTVRGLGVGVGLSMFSRLGVVV